MSGVATAQGGSEEREYCLHVFYTHSEPYTYEVYVVMTWNTEAHITVSTELNVPLVPMAHIYGNQTTGTYLSYIGLS